jgi:hypothetical protein
MGKSKVYTWMRSTIFDNISETGKKFLEFTKENFLSAEEMLWEKSCMVVVQWITTL